MYGPVKNKIVLSYKFSIPNMVLFKILTSSLFLKYPKFFANFRLDVLIKNILIKKERVCPNIDIT